MNSLLQSFTFVLENPGVLAVAGTLQFCHAKLGRGRYQSFYLTFTTQKSFLCMQNGDSSIVGSHLLITPSLIVTKQSEEQHWPLFRLPVPLSSRWKRWGFNFTFPPSPNSLLGTKSHCFSEQHWSLSISSSCHLPPSVTSPQVLRLHFLVYSRRLPPSL